MRACVSIAYIIVLLFDYVILHCLITSSFYWNVAVDPLTTGEQNMCIYVSEICAEGIFVSFPWWLNKLKNRSKIALSSNERHFEIWFPKKKPITLIGRKLSKLHKKEIILHVTITFSLKQGGTRTSSGPISLTLKDYNLRKDYFLFNVHLFPITILLRLKKLIQ